MRAIATSLIFLPLLLTIPAHAFAGTLRQPHFSDPCGCQPVTHRGWVQPRHFERVAPIASSPCQPVARSVKVSAACCGSATVFSPPTVRRQATVPGPAVSSGPAFSEWQSAPLGYGSPQSNSWGQSNGWSAGNNWSAGNGWGQGIGGPLGAVPDAGLGWNGATGGGLWPSGGAAPHQVLDLRNMPDLLQNVTNSGMTGTGQGGVLMLSWELTDTNVVAGMAGGLDAPLGGVMGGGGLEPALNGGGGLASSGLGLADFFPINSLFGSNPGRGFSGGSPGAGGSGGWFPGGGGGSPGGGGGPPSWPPGPPPPFFPEPPFPSPDHPEPGPLPPGPVPVVAPEPSTLLIFAMGAMVLTVVQVRRRHAAGRTVLGCSG